MGVIMNKNINIAVNVINRNLKVNSLENYFSKFYLFSNENLSGYLKENDYIGKSAITVGSSGDQVFNLINYGCEDITLYDINPNIKYYYDLKKAAIYGLDKEQFFEFLLGFKILFKNRKFFNYETYLKISKYLDSDSKIFWDYLFNNIFDMKKLFFNDFLGMGKLIHNNDYLKEDFNILRRKMDKSNVSICNGDIYNLDKLNNKYDYIFLSNVFDYFYDVPNYDNLMKNYFEYTSLLDKIKLLLNDDGKLFFHYLWFYKDSDGFVFFNTKFFNEDSNYFEKRIPSSHLIPSDFDCVYGYHKKKILTK